MIDLCQLALYPLQGIIYTLRMPCQPAGHLAIRHAFQVTVQYLLLQRAEGASHHLEDHLWDLAIDNPLFGVRYCRIR